MKFIRRYNGIKPRFSEDYLIENFSLPNAILAPCFVFLWIILHNEMPYAHKLIFGANALMYLFLYFLLRASSFFKRNRKLLYQGAYIITSAIAFYLTYYNGFKVDYTIMQMMISIYICISFEDIYFLIYYLIFIVTSMVAVLIFRIYNNQYNEYELTFIICFVVLAIAAVILHRTRDRDLRNLYEMAYYDPLTGLANRRYLQSYLVGEMEKNKLEYRIISILFIDIDNFKKINDTMGHSYGDLILAKIANTILLCLAKEDFLAKYGGDEFVAVLSSSSQSYSEQIAKRIIETFSKPLVVSGKKNEITASIGISQFPKDAQKGEDLIRKADIAMYYGKSSGKNTFNFFSKEIRERIYKSLLFEKSLRNAQARNELEMYYQPIIDLNSGNIISAEALIRWNHPEYGLIFPGDFIPIAEENGLIIPIGEWVLATVCKQNKEWQRIGLHPITIAVNVSYHQLASNNFIVYLKNLLEESGLEAHFLELEITESILRKASDLKLFVDELKPMGIKLAIDDFGVGYSSLSILQHVDFNNLKIDMSFIREIPINPKSVAMVKTIIEIGKIIDCKITAEGVELPEQVEFLKKNQCSNAQGYLFSTPINAKQFAELLANYGLSRE
ncbi:MAG: EAL domain-containing protein [Mobilitalea sp.]